MTLPHARCQTRAVAERDRVKKNQNRSSTPISEAFRAFIQSGWLPRPSSSPARIEHAELVAQRRSALSARFEGVALVIPASDVRQRSNDTEYAYRPHTAFSYLTGWGSDTVPASILVGLPEGSEHQWSLYFRAPAPRTSDEFYANAAIGEFWTGPRPTLHDISALLGLPTHDLGAWKDLEETLSTVAVLREADPDLAARLDRTRPSQKSSPSLDDELAREVSEARLLKDPWEIEQMKQAVGATHRGFDDIIRALPQAINHPRGERLIEGVFHQRARVEGNDVGYGTIAASGPHACILHWVTNDGPITDGDLLLVDAGVELDSLYTADITRTIPVSGSFSPLQRQVYDAVLEAADAAFAIVKPGIKFSDVHKAAMAVIAQKTADWGFLPVDVEESLSPEGQHHRRYMIHGTSHHLGLDVHDCAQARREMYMDKELEPGMVFTIEPGLYFQPDDETVPPPWRGIGVRIEDDILVTAEGAINLSAGIPRTAADVERWVKSGGSSLD